MQENEQGTQKGEKSKKKMKHDIDHINAPTTVHRTMP